MTLLERLRGISEPVICVHNGRFHADELLALAVIKTALPDRKIVITRSREPEAWRQADLVLDVGGKDNPFDHHYFGSPRHDNGIPYAACGLVLDAIEPDAKLRRQLYVDMFYSVEWDDNTRGGEISSPNWDLKPNLLAFVPFYQPLREETVDEHTVRTYFDSALEMTCKIYKRVRQNAILKLKNRAIQDKTTYMVTNGILWLPSPTLPYARYVYEHKEVKAVVIPENGGTFTIKCQRDPNDPVPRAAFPHIMCGLGDADLERVSRIHGLVYCSNTGDRCTARTIKAAQQAIRLLS